MTNLKNRQWNDLTSDLVSNWGGGREDGNQGKKGENLEFTSFHSIIRYGGKAGGDPYVRKYSTKTCSGGEVKGGGSPTKEKKKIMEEAEELFSIRRSAKIGRPTRNQRRRQNEWQRREEILEGGGNGIWRHKGVLYRGC